MKKDFFSIEDLAQGKCAVINDGTLEELREVLIRAGQKPNCCFNKHLYYIVNMESFPVSRHVGSDQTDLPTQSVKDFLHDFRVGDLVAHHCKIGFIFTITDIDKGKAELIHNNSKHRSRITLPVDDLIPYFKKGDKAEVLENLNVFGWDSQLVAGDVIEFDKDNTFGGITFGIGDLKRLFKRIRSGELKYDISDIELKTLNAAKKAHKESIKEINAKISELRQAVNDAPTASIGLRKVIPTDFIVQGNWLVDCKDGKIVPSSDFLDFYSKGVESYKKFEDNPLADKKNTDLSDAIGTCGNLLDHSNKILDWVESIKTERLADIRVRQPERHSHYDNENGSLYKIAEQLGLNTYEFDILKRIARCRKKGQFKDDLQKIKDTVDLYLKEVDNA